MDGVQSASVKCGMVVQSWYANYVLHHQSWYANYVLTVFLSNMINICQAFITVPRTVFVTLRNTFIDSPVRIELSENKSSD